MLNVPVIHATHKACFMGASLFDSNKICERPIVGAAQIITQTDDVLKSLSSDDASGIITSVVIFYTSI